jgi:hypothetical protein
MENDGLEKMIQHDPKIKIVHLACQYICPTHVLPHH